MNLDQSGQHYMIDKKLIKYIADEAMLLSDDVVLEIGCGHGELTRELSKKCKVIAVDIEDNDIKGKNIIFEKANILEAFAQLYEKYGFNKIISNIPYAISEPLMKKIFKIDIELVLLVVGDNFSGILSKKNSRLGIIANEIYDVSILKTIPAKAFFPMPRTQSALVSLEPRDLDVVGKPAVFYKEIVMLDELKLRNALMRILKGNKKELKARLSGPLFERKLYQLSNIEFMELDRFLRQA